MIGSSFAAGSSSSSSSSSSPDTDFQLKEAIKHAPDPEIIYQILTKIIEPSALTQIEKLDYKLAILICKALRCVHGYVTDRTYVEGQEDFFTHSAADVIFESKTGVSIKGKCHALKAASHYNSVMNALAQIKRALTFYENDLTIKPILSRYYSLFKAHKNVLLFALQQLDDTKKKKVEVSGGVRLSKQCYAPLQADDEHNISQTLPTTPSPYKVPFERKRTPKALTATGKRSTALLVNFSQRLAALEAASLLSSAQPVHPRQNSKRPRVI